MVWPVLTVLLTIWSSAIAGAREVEPLSFYVNYSAHVPTAPLQIQPLAIVHPDAEIDLTKAHESQTQVLAYLSVGEIANDAPYRVQALKLGLRMEGENPIWHSNYLDLTDSGWADLIVDQLATEAVQKGFDGFFLDTLDSVDVVAPDDAARTTQLRTALITLIKRLHSTYPDKKIIVNRGFFAFDQLKDVIDGVLVESLYSTWDFKAKVNKPVASEETADLLVQLQKVKTAGREVYVIDYASPVDFAAADHTANQIRAHGFHAFVTTPELDGVMLAPLRVVPRRVCTFYGNLSDVPDDKVEWPAGSFTAKHLQTPLEWLGYEVDYFHIESAADLPALSDDYRAIMLPRNWEIPLTLESDFLDWLIAQRRTGKKILIFGSLPFRDYQQLERFIKVFGMTGTGGITDTAVAINFVNKDPSLLGFETKIIPQIPGHLNLQAPAGAQVILDAEATLPDQSKIRFDAIFTCDWGGVSLDPYTLFTRADFVEFWNLDPFSFLTKVLGDFNAPAPDTTTRDGCRLFLNHIDGDGFANGNWVEPGRYSSEVVRDRILKKYPLPVTVSVIEAEVRGLVKGQDENETPKFEAIARDIFKLPNVEVASHSYSHPFYWINGDPTSSNYDEQYLPLKIPYPAINYVREVDGSVKYINEQLTTPEKPVKVFLWSGNCRPPPEALALVRKLGIVNLNGGDTLISPRKPTVTAVAPRTMPWGDELQIFAPNQNENVYTNDWRGPLYGTFTHVIDTFKLTETPRRLKPVNVYYHFYSADFPASLNALETIYDWVMTQPLHSIKVSVYARLARDARRTKIYTSGQGRWTIVNEGFSRTLRLPSKLAQRISLANSKGVTGWRLTGDDAYVHTNGSSVVTLALADQPVVVQARLVSSTAEISFQQLSVKNIVFKSSDLRPAQILFAGLVPSSTYEANINHKTSRISVTAEGQLELEVPAQATVRLQSTAP